MTRRRNQRSRRSNHPVPSQHTAKVSDTHKHETETKPEQDNGKGHVESEALLPTALQQSIVEAQSYKATDTPYNQKDQSRPSRKWFSRIRTKHWLAISSVILAVVAIFQLIAIYRQAEIMKEQADIAASQATLMDKQLAIMQDTLDQSKLSGEETSAHTDRLIDANEKLTDANKTQADASGKSASAAERSANIAQQSLIIGQRPRIGVISTTVTTLEAGKPVVIEVVLLNSGVITARKVTIRSFLFARNAADGQSNRCHDLPERIQPPDGLISSITMPPDGRKLTFLQSSVSITDAEVAAIKEGKIWIYAWCYLEYYGDWTDNKYFVEHFIRYNPISTKFDGCPTRNDSN
jgi:hypothetical protein